MPGQPRPSPAAKARAEVLVVGSRWGRILLVTGVSLIAMMGMVWLRRDPQADLEDKLWTGTILVIAFWVMAQGLGIIVRRARAGHAMRFDAAGFHFPGWDVVPWSAIRGLSIELKEDDDGKTEYFFCIDIDPACRAARRGSYERWMFGPTEGLFGAGPIVKIKTVTMDVEPAELRAIFDGWQHRIAPSPRRVTR